LEKPPFMNNICDACLIGNDENLWHSGDFLYEGKGKEKKMTELFLYKLSRM